MAPCKRWLPVALILVVLLAAGCAARPAPSVQVSPKPAQPTAVPAPTRSAAATPAPAAAPREVAAQQAGLSGPAPSPYEAGRKIIKNGEMNLLVQDTDRAVGRVTDIAVFSGGYVISSQTEVKSGAKFATMVLGVPVERFEAVQSQLREIAIQVLSETASGQDVTDEYVDLQSRLNNLEATRARVREFLNQAKTVEEALKVNAQLSEIEGEIEKVKGRMNYIKDRAAFSTLTVHLEPQRPTPTPTFTPTPTATPTPVVWRPGETFEDATSALGTLLRGFGDFLIWLVIVILPFTILVGILIAIPVWLIRRLVKPKRRAPAAPAPKTEATPKEPTGS